MNHDRIDGLTNPIQLEPNWTSYSLIQLPPCKIEISSTSKETKQTLEAISKHNCKSTSAFPCPALSGPVPAHTATRRMFVISTRDANNTTLSYDYR